MRKQKCGRFLCSLMIGSLLLVLVGQSFIRPSVGSAQDDFSCPITLSEDDCDVLLSTQTALDEAGSVRIDAYDLTASIVLGSDSVALSSTGSGDVLFEDGGIVAADFRFEEGTFSSADTHFEGAGVLRYVDGNVYIGTVEDDGVMDWVGVELDAIRSQLGFLSGFRVLFEELNDVPTVITWARDEDFVVDDKLVAPFYMDFSARGLLQSSAFVEWLAAGLAETFADSVEGELISPTLATAIVSELANQLSGDIGDEYIFRITQLISLEDFQLQRLTVELDFTMDLDFLGGFAASVGGDSPDSLSIVVDFDARFGAYGEDVLIEGPETYEDKSEEIVGLFDSLVTDAIAGMGVGDDGEASTPTDESVELVVDEPITGMLAADGEANSYRFEASAGDVVQIAVRADANNNLDTYLELFDAGGERLADNDDAVSPPSELNLGPVDSYIEYEIEEDGVYFVEVSSVFVGDEGAYTMILRIE